MPSLNSPRPTPFHPSIHITNFNNDDNDAYIDIRPTYTTHPLKNHNPNSYSPTTQPTPFPTPTQHNRCPHHPTAITPEPEKPSAFVNTTTYPLATNHHPTYPQLTRHLHALPHPLLFTSHSLLPPNTTTPPPARLIHLLGLALNTITILTYLIARYRAGAAGSVMEEAVVRVEFETRMRDVLMAVVGGVLWVTVREGGDAGVVRRAGGYVGVAVGVYVGAVRGVDWLGVKTCAVFESL